MWNDLKTRMYLLLAGARGEDGQALVEYSLILALVSVAGIVALTAIGVDVGKALTTVEKALAGA
jgi:Flp pilus assembly pilin Flp